MTTRAYILNAMLTAALGCGRSVLLDTSGPVEGEDGPVTADIAGATSVGASGQGGLAGPVGSSSGGGLGGSGGSGGAAVIPIWGCATVHAPRKPYSGACKKLQVHGPALVELGSALPARGMGLAHASADRECVTVVMERPSSETGEPELVATTFEPWLQWPGAHPLAPPKRIPLSEPTSGEFAVGPSLGGRITLAWRKAAGGTRFSWNLDPHTLDGGYVDTAIGDRPITCGVSPLGYILQVSHDTYGWIETQYWLDDGQYGSLLSGYGSQPLAAAVLREEGVITAAEHHPKGPTYAPPHPIGTHIKLSCHWDITGMDFLQTLEAGGELVKLAMVPHPAGVWVVWRTAGPQSLSRWALVAVKNIQHSEEINAGTFGEPGELVADVAAAALGKRLATARTVVSPGGSQVVVQVADESGEVLSEAAIGVPYVTDSLRVLPGPDEGSLLVAWAPGQLARFDCED